MRSAKEGPLREMPLARLAEKLHVGSRLDAAGYMDVAGSVSRV
jgi:hypothetical protein